MATIKINEDALIIKADKAVNKELGVSTKTPAAKMEYFNEKVKAAVFEVSGNLNDAIQDTFDWLGQLISQYTLTY